MDEDGSTYSLSPRVRPRSSPGGSPFRGGRIEQVKPLRRGPASEDAAWQAAGEETTFAAEVQQELWSHTAMEATLQDFEKYISTQSLSSPKTVRSLGHQFERAVGGGSHAARHVSFDPSAAALSENSSGSSGGTSITFGRISNDSKESFDRSYHGKHRVLMSTPARRVAYKEDKGDKRNAASQGTASVRRTKRDRGTPEGGAPQPSQVAHDHPARFSDPDVYEKLLRGRGSGGGGGGPGTREEAGRGLSAAPPGTRDEAGRGRSAAPPGGSLLSRNIDDDDEDVQKKPNVKYRDSFDRWLNVQSPQAVSEIHAHQHKLTSIIFANKDEIKWPNRLSSAAPRPVNRQADLNAEFWG